MLLPLLVLLFTLCISHAEIGNYEAGVKLCQVICMERGSCGSVSYEARTLTCRLLSRATEEQMEKGYTRFPRGKDIPFTGACSLQTCPTNTRCLENHRGRAVCVQDNPLSMLKKRCKENEDCASVNLLCVQRRCECAVAFSFNPADNTCVKRCKVYGNQSTLYNGYGIKPSHKMKNKHFVNSLSGCSQKCYKEAAFTCISFVYWYGANICKTFAFGWSTFPLGQHTKTHACFGKRNCA